MDSIKTVRDWLHGQTLPLEVELAISNVCDTLDTRVKKAAELPLHPFKEGDRVIVRALPEGPAMVVVAVYYHDDDPSVPNAKQNRPSVSVIWFDTSHQHHSMSFYADLFEKAGEL